jgi:type VI secretion system secreted protein VgrG
MSAHPIEFELEVGPHAGADLLVVTADASEELSRPWTLEVVAAVHPDTTVDPPALVGQRAVLAVAAGDAERCFHGIVASVESWSEGAEGMHRRLRLEIVPALWKLGQGRNSRIFQGKTVPEIAIEVLDQGGVKHRQALSDKHPKRTYVVQYAESDLDFVSRLLEEEGIFFFFEQDRDQHVVVLADSNSACAAIPGGAELVFREPSRMSAGIDHLDAFALRVEVRPGKVALRDFAYLRPDLDLTAGAQVETERELEVYDYPGRYEDAAAGAVLARIRLEETRARAECVEGAGPCRRLAPGFRFELDDHPTPAVNGEFLVVGARHRARDTRRFGGTDADVAPYRCEVRAIRSSVPFRPERRTARPVIPGPQTATVVGPPGEEIFCDEHGRIKVQFHWDRLGGNDDRSSCWVRVSQAWAGPGWGALYLPRIDQEVVVEFEEGDPDRPLVTGAVYNGMNPPPLDLPAEKTRSTLRSASTPGSLGFNELRFEDSSGSEEVFLHAQKDLAVVVENDRTERVGGNETLTVGGDRSRQVGGDQTLNVGGNDTSTIAGNQVLEVGGTRTTTVGGSHTETVGRAQSVTVDANQTVTVAGASVETVGAAKALNVGGAYAVNVGAAMNELVVGAKTEEVGGAKVEVVGARRTETVAGSRAQNVGGDLAETVGGNRTLKVAKDLVVNVGGKLSHTVKEVHAIKGKELVLTAEERFIVKVGSATLEIKKDGTVVVKGGKLELKASGDLVLKASKISEN